MIFRSNRCSSCSNAIAIADWLSHKESAHKPHSLTQRLTSTTRGRDRLVMERENECICRARETSSQGEQAVGRAMCLWLGDGAKIGSTPLPRGSNVRGERERDAQRMRERENQGTHKLRVNFTIFFSPSFSCPMMGGVLLVQDLITTLHKANWGVVRPTY